MVQDFKGRRVVVTGGATGLGAAVATLAAERGGSVVILDVNEAAGRPLAAALGATYLPCDVSDPASWRTAGEAIAAGGGADYAHLNAGIMTQGVGRSLEHARIENVSYERYRAVTGVNADGVFLGIKTLLPLIIAKGGGAIAATSSAAGLIPIPFDPIYAMTKHAVVGLIRSLALAFADSPVRLNAFCPGGIDTQIVPPELAGNPAAMMTPAIAAEEVASLLLSGANGEIRLKLRAGQPGVAVPPPDITLGG